MNFKDNFSKQSDVYLRYRPQYPGALYDYLVSLCAGRELAWDCGTGNGQAAVDLAAFFDRVIATDPSEQQINNAMVHDKVSYAVAKAEEAPLNDNSVDLLTVATALHWFDFDRFYPEAKRVMKPDAVIAAWAYGNPAGEPEINALIDQLHDNILGDYWLVENRLSENNYQNVPFPFEEIKGPEFKIEKLLNFEELTGLFNTWSAVQRYKDKNGSNPVQLIENELLLIWGDKEEPKLFTWQLALRVGRNKK